MRPIAKIVVALVVLLAVFVLGIYSQQFAEAALSITAGNRDIFLLLIAVVLGAVITWTVAFWFESVHKPKLKIRIHESKDQPPEGVSFSPEHPAKIGKFVYLEVFNTPIRGWLARWMQRNVAFQCHGAISFHRLDGQRIFDDSMVIRWSNASSPNIWPVGINGRITIVTDADTFPLKQRMNVSPDESEPIDVAGRFDNEQVCYGWNNESFRSQNGWRNERWKLEKGTYLIKATIFAGGEKCSDTFRLVNEGSRKDFRIEPRQPRDLVL